jgi:hypothetical protein
MKIQFSTNGAAFGSEYEDEATNDIYTREEVVRILKKITAQIEDGEEWGSIMDINGNKIGEWSL